MIMIDNTDFESHHQYRQTDSNKNSIIGHFVHKIHSRWLLHQSRLFITVLAVSCKCHYTGFRGLRAPV